MHYDRDIHGFSHIPEEGKRLLWFLPESQPRMGWHQQYAVSSGGFDRLCVLDGLNCSFRRNPRDNGDLPVEFVSRYADYFSPLLGKQEVDLASVSINHDSFDPIVACHPA